MTPITLPKILIGAGLALALIGFFAFGLDKAHQAQGARDQAAAQTLIGEAQAHAHDAQQVPDHSAALAQAEASVAQLKAQLASTRRRLDSLAGSGVGNSVPDNSAVGQIVDSGDQEKITAQSDVIAKQDALIKAQDDQIGELTLALSDEKRRSAEWKAAFEASVKGAQAQQAATEAWKKAVTESRWTGRAEGFAIGVLSGYLGGKLH